jgi:hypothetical protein
MREKAESLSDCKNISSGLTKTLNHNMLFSLDDQTTLHHWEKWVLPV